MTFAVECRTWFTWCPVPGCQNCMRNGVGELARLHCAEHVSAYEMLRISSTPAFELAQVLHFTLTMRLVPVPREVRA